MPGGARFLGQRDGIAFERRLQPNAVLPVVSVNFHFATLLPPSRRDRSGISVRFLPLLASGITAQFH